MAGVKILLSVDWEGEDFSALRDFQEFRNEIGTGIPLTHFICPAYFIKYTIASDLIAPEIRDYDEVGLHIHPLQELLQHFHVNFRAEHNFYRPTGHTASSTSIKRMQRFLTKNLQKKVTGRGVPLSVYDDKDLTKIINESRKLITKNLGIENIPGFRSGGNMASDSVLDAIRSAGFQYDSSAIPPEILSSGYNRFSSGNMRDGRGDRNGLYTEYVLKLWGREIAKDHFLKNRQIHQFNPSPYILKTSQPFQFGDLWEFPLNGGMSDFVSSKNTLVPVFLELLSLAEKNEKEMIMSIGFHMEGSWKHKKSVLDFLSYLDMNQSGNFSFSTPTEMIQESSVERKQA